MADVRDCLSPELKTRPGSIPGDVAKNIKGVDSRNIFYEKKIF